MESGERKNSETVRGILLLAANRSKRKRSLTDLCVAKRFDAFLPNQILAAGMSLNVLPAAAGSLLDGFENLSRSQLGNLSSQTVEVRMRFTIGWSNSFVERQELFQRNIQASGEKHVVHSSKLMGSVVESRRDLITRLPTNA